MEEKKRFGAWEITVKEDADGKVVSGRKDTSLTKPTVNNTEKKGDDQ